MKKGLFRPGQHSEEQRKVTWEILYKLFAENGVAQSCLEDEKVITLRWNPERKHPEVEFGEKGEKAVEVRPQSLSPEKKPPKLTKY
jgi:hypothetical protein